MDEMSIAKGNNSISTFNMCKMIFLFIFINLLVFCWNANKMKKKIPKCYNWNDLHFHANLSNSGLNINIYTFSTVSCCQITNTTWFTQTYEMCFFIWPDWLESHNVVYIKNTIPIRKHRKFINLAFDRIAILCRRHKRKSKCDHRVRMSSVEWSMCIWHVTIWRHASMPDPVCPIPTETLCRSDCPTPCIGSKNPMRNE